MLRLLSCRNAEDTALTKRIAAWLDEAHAVWPRAIPELCTIDTLAVTIKHIAAMWQDDAQPDDGAAKVLQSQFIEPVQALWRPFADQAKKLADSVEENLNLAQIADAQCYSVLHHLSRRIS